ncbi:ORF6C domain-containing protein [Paenibacillus polymyxa]|uniref:ORF6C domain-containing protein n=1 Tax=Paenibacillus polymyxa TaxID=1406 RepID=UPI002ED0FE9B|nr:ORF6C domain-containing protein [Paenibacillus polymyxa]
MTQLVFIENGRAVTDSLTVAKVFGKDHDHVMRDVRQQLNKLQEAGEAEWGVSNFGETQYQHHQNKQWYPKFEMTEDAFAIVAMSYTTPEAMKMKVKFLTEFKRMKEILHNPPVPVLDSNAAIAIALRQTADVMDKLPQIESRMDRIENTTTIDYGQQRALKKAGSSRVVGFLGGRKSAAYKHSGIRSSAYSALWNDYQEHFGINSYNNTLKKDCERGLKYVATWTPPNNLLIEIEETNGQKLF